MCQSQSAYIDRRRGRALQLIQVETTHANRIRKALSGAVERLGCLILANSKALKKMEVLFTSQPNFNLHSQWQSMGRSVADSRGIDGDGFLFHAFQPRNNFLFKMPKLCAERGLCSPCISMPRWRSHPLSFSLFLPYWADALNQQSAHEICAWCKACN